MELHQYSTGEIHIMKRTLASNQLLKTNKTTRLYIRLKEELASNSKWLNSKSVISEASSYSHLHPIEQKLERTKQYIA
jgi:hypothetical protein